MTNFSDNLFSSLEAYARSPSSQHIEINRDRVEVKRGAKGPPVDQTISALSKAIGQAEFSPEYKFDQVLFDVRILRSQNKSWLTGESKKNKEAFDKLEATILNKQKESTFPNDNELKEILNLPDTQRTNKLMLLAAKFPPQMFQNLDKLKLFDPKEREAILYLCLSHIDPNEYINLAKFIAPSRQEDLVAIAKIIAEKEPLGLARNFEKFQIDPSRQDDLVAIAKICAEKEPRGLLDNFEKFQIDPSRQDDLVAIAKIIAEKEPLGLARNFEKFQIDPSRQDDLVAIAKICAKKAPWKLLDNFEKFQIDPSRQDDLVALAKIMAETEKPWLLASHFEKFQIDHKRQDDLVALAKIIAEKEPEGLAYNFEKFQIDPSRQDDLVAIAKIIAETEKPWLLASHFEKFQIDHKRQDDLVALAKICAEKNPGRLVRNFEKFQIDPSRQDDLVALAMIIAEKDPWGLADNFEKFQIAPSRQDDLVAIAKIIAEKEPWKLADNFEKFQIDPSRQDDLVAIAKIIAEKDPRTLLENFEKFQIDHERQDDLVALAKICAEKDPRTLLENFEKFQIDHKRQDDLVALAKICAEKDSHQLAHNFTRFQIDDERQDDLVALAKICAEKDPRTLLENFEKFQIDPSRQDDLVALAKIIAEKEPEALAVNFRKFQIDSDRQDDLVALAKIMAEKDPWELANNFEKFKINSTRQKDLVAIAKICAEKVPKVLAYYFEKFKIDDERQDDLVALAKIVAEKDPRDLAAFFKKFQIDPSRQDDLVALAKIIAEKEPEALAVNFEKFQIDDERQDDLVALAKIVAEKVPRGLADNFRKFQIDSDRQDDLVALAKIVAEKVPRGLADNFEKFQIDSDRQDDLVALAKICAEKEPGSLAVNFEKFQIEASRRKEVIRQIDPNRVDIDKLPQVRGLARNHEFFSRIREKDPALFIDLIMGSDMPKELKEFTAFLETHEVDLISLLSFEYRMNPSLPMRKEVVQLFLDFKSSPDLVKLRLAMQTHPDFEEIARMAKGGIPEAKLSPKEAFFELEIEEQRSQMLRAQILRERDALPIANRILKDASEGKPVDNELLEQALKHYKKVGAEASGKVHERLTTLIKDPQQKTHIKAHAIQALAEIENDPQNANRKAFLLNELQNTNNPVLQVVLLDALARYTFTAGEDLAQIKSMIRTLSSKDPLDTNLKKSLVYLATTIPDEETLKIAYQLVNTEPWDTTASKQNLAIRGDFNLFPYRPTAHDSQKQLNFVIGQRLVELKRTEMEKRAQEILGEYKANPDSHASLAQLKRNIKGFQSGIRYYPTPLFMPAGTVCFRGINAKKGEKLAEAAFLDFWVKGSGSSDLSLFDNSSDGTWSKVGQMFSSTTLDYVMNGYFDETGMLMTVPGEALNEQILRRNIRLQREDSIHFVSYTRLAHHQISQLFISNVSQPRIEALARAPLKVTDKTQKTPTMEKMARLNLERTPSELLSLKAPSELLSLKDRVSYFDPKNNLATEIREKMTPLGLREATTQEIIDENLTRHIMLGLLKDHLTDPDLIATFAEPPTIEPLEVINR